MQLIKTCLASIRVEKQLCFLEWLSIYEPQSQSNILNTSRNIKFKDDTIFVKLFTYSF